MIKPESLRTALTDLFPAFATNPDQLKMWVDRGGIVHRASGSNRAFSFRYTLNLVITDWQGLPTGIFLVINDWLAIHQPDLVTAQTDQAYTYEADIIDAQTIDLSIELPLTEIVTVVARVDGGADLQHRGEPANLFPDMAPVADPAPLLTEIWWRDERLIPGTPLPGTADGGLA